MNNKKIYSTIVTAILAGGISAHAEINPNTNISGSTGYNVADQFPTDAKAGECYARVILPAKKEMIKTQVLVSEATEKLKTIPATYKTVSQTVVVKEASERLVPVPATYKTITENIVTKPAETRLVRVPATYKTITERIMVKPASTKWKAGDGGSTITKVDHSTGEVLCLVEEPAVYKTVTKRVVATPATSREEMIPAVTTTITKRVVDQPATYKKVMIPAETRTVQIRQEATPARTVATVVPAQYTTVTAEKIVTAEKPTWAPILCKTNTTPGVVRRIQTALKAKGHYNGPIDGDFGRGTTNAVSKYQRANGQAQGGLTFATLRSLGVSL